MWLKEFFKNVPKYVPLPGYKFICFEGGEWSNVAYSIIYLFIYDTYLYVYLTIYFPSPPTTMLALPEQGFCLFCSLTLF